MDAKDLYPSLIQMIIQAENITWNRFNNFLMVNAILVAAWSVVYVDSSSLPMRSWPLGAFCVIGAISSILWAFLGSPGRTYLDKYLDVAAELETDHDAWGNKLNKVDYKLATTTKAVTKKLNECICMQLGSSTFILKAVPIILFFLYSLLFCVSLKS